MKSKGPSERQIEEACDDLLMLDGWRIIKTDLPHLRGLGVQEKGMPDRCYLRYEKEGPPPPPADVFPYDYAWCQHLWIEWKKRGGKAAEHQKAWHAAERARGALVLVAGEDFPASVDGFLSWYNGSGLALRKFSLKAVPGGWKWNTEAQHEGVK